MRPFFLLLAALAWLCAAAPAQAAGERPLYTIAVGQNQVPAALRNDGSNLVKLRYADDDAVQVYSLLERASQKAFLLSVLDAETQRRFPALGRRARTPSQTELDNVVELVRAAMARDRAAGREPVLVFFFSGHGVRDDSGGAALALFDGALNRDWLYESLLARLPARFVHLIIDSCHAEALVRTRDADAVLEPVSDAELAGYVESATLERFPHVGAILASTANTQSFEWDGYRGGVFAHELLSGLRGGADVNADGRVEYSELAAFLSAANLQVADPRARLSIVVKPPSIDRRAVILDHAKLRGQFKLVGRAEGDWARAFFVETESGQRVLDAFPERGARISLRLPAHQRLFLVRADGEVELSAAEGGQIDLGALRARPLRTRVRGALDDSLRRGLFGTRFGPAFYSGYVSQRDGLVSVPLLSEPEERRVEGAALQASDRRGNSLRKPVGTALLIGAGAAALSAGVFAGLTLDARADYEGTNFERSASEARERFYRYQSWGWLSAGSAAALGAAGAMIILWPEPADSARASTVSIDGLAVTASGLQAFGSFE